VKKVLITLFLISILSPNCYGVQRYTSEQLLDRIERASVNLRTLKMESYWKKLCKQDTTTCTEKKDWYEKLLFDTKVRQHDVYLIRGGFHVRY